MSSAPATSTIEELEKQIEDLKTQLREARLANKGVPFGDYEFETESGPVKLSELFGGCNELLIWHNMGKGCNYCTLWADGLTGYMRHFATRCPLVVVSPDQVAVQKAIAAERGWNFKMVRDASTEFSEAAGFYQDFNGKKGFWPGVSSFVKNPDGTITHLNKAIFGPGDDFCMVWPAMELLPGGIGDWEPS